MTIQQIEDNFEKEFGMFVIPATKENPPKDESYIKSFYRTQITKLLEEEKEKVKKERDEMWKTYIYDTEDEEIERAEHSQIVAKKY